MKVGTWYSLEEFVEAFNDHSKATEKERRKKLLSERDYYHKASFYPDWFNDAKDSFLIQVNDMASSTKPFKASDTFKIQGGYPHEVEKDNFARLTKYGINKDINCKANEIMMPKMDTQTFTTLLNNNSIISFCTPKDTNFIREIVVIDETSNPTLIFFYVISRKSRVLSAWSIKKPKEGKFIPKLHPSEVWKYRQP